MKGWGGERDEVWCCECTLMNDMMFNFKPVIFMCPQLALLCMHVLCTHSHTHSHTCTGRQAVWTGDNRLPWSRGSDHRPLCSAG